MTTRVALSVWLSLLAAAAATAADPLYLVRPFDEITLDEDNAGVRLKVLPLKLPGRKMPAADNRQEDLEIELVDRPGERFRVGWNNIAGVKFFEELVLAEAETHVQGARFDEAYPYFEFLETRYPGTAGLKEAMENYLWAQIGADFTARRNDAALALLVELHRRNPQRQGLATAFERVTLKLVEQRIAAENFRGARALLTSLTQRYPDKGAAAAAYEAQLRDKAAAALSAARQALAGGKLREANLAARGALAIWPAIEGGRELAAEIHQRHPVVAVGVTSAAGDWAARRTGPLIAPPLFAVATDGEHPYRSQWAQVGESKVPTQVLLRLDPTSPVSAHDVARTMLAAADSQQAVFDPPLAALLSRVEVRSDEEVSIQLQRPPLRPEAWLSMRLPGGGAFRRELPAAEQSIFVRTSPAAAAGQVPPMEIIERMYADGGAALRGLKRGEVSLVDRVNPWELKSLAGRSEIVVGQYASPSLHLLVPNSNRPLAANRTLKRAILYGIDRQSILQRSLLNGESIAGCTVTSGPFPRGASKNDPRGYAYDEDVAVRAYDPGLALALARLAQPDAPPRPLVLAHPASDVPRAACQSIARQLDAVGIPITLREDALGQAADDADLTYVELSVREPLVDVWRLFGARQFAGPASPPMLAALRRLEGAGDMTAAAAHLKEIHALAAAELPVIPLWQLVDHFAHHASVKGIDPRPASLYQNVDAWQVQLTLPSE